MQNVTSKGRSGAVMPFMSGIVLVLAAALLALPSRGEDCRPKACFYWISDCLSRDGLSTDIAALSDAGISEAYICAAHMAGRCPKSVTAKLLSPAWMDLFSHAVQEARAKGLKFGFHNCPGWSESGGPWIRPEDSMKLVVYATKDVSPGKSAGALPQPVARCGFYRDLATLAFPVEPTPQIVAATCDFGGDAWAFAQGRSSLTLPLAKGTGARWTVSCRYAGHFSPASAILRFVDKNVNCEGFVEGSADGKSWQRLADFCYHFHFVPAKSDKILSLKSVGPIDRIRVVFRANGVPEWQGGKPVDIRLDSIGLSCAPMVSDADVKSSASTVFGYVPPKEPSVKGVACADWVDLSQHLRADGTLDWAPPLRSDGKVWRVVRLGYTTSGKTCAPATLSGLECDKLSRRGLDAHWPNMPAKLLAVPGARDVITSFYIDSWEAGGQNWTEGFDDEFRKRRGYDLKPYLSVFAGFVVEDATTTAKALFDIQQTVADLIAENYFAYFTELCHAAGVSASIEAYGGAFDHLRCLGLADWPAGELWIGGNYEHSLKMASSAAHVTGKDIAESETFTTEFAPGRWQITPHELKQWGDVAWQNGINRIIYHSYIHQPLRASPGLSLGRHGTQLNRNSTWWPEMKHWSDYVRRGQELLSSGRPVADLLIVADEGRPNDCTSRNFKLNDFQYDLASVHDFRRMSCRGRGVGLEKGADYPAVFLAGTHYSLNTLRRIRELAVQGVKIAGRRPIDTPTMADDMRSWRALRDSLWGGSVLEASEARVALEKWGARPAVVSSSPSLRFVSRETDAGGKVFFVVNRSDKPFDGPVAFAASGNGEVRDLAHGTTWRFDGRLSLPPQGGVFVVFGKNQSAALQKGEPRQTVDLSTGWKITSFSGLQAPKAPLALDGLIDWSQADDLKLRYFSGRAVYEKKIEMASLKDALRVGLDLGEVHDIANVWVNGKFVGCLWEPPYVIDMTSVLSTSTPCLDLRIEVVNTLPNRLIGDAILRAKGAEEPKGEAGWPIWVIQNCTESGSGLSTWSNFDWAWKATDKLRPAGLLGPVRLILR